MTMCFSTKMTVLNCTITKEPGGQKTDFITERQTGPQCDLSDVKCSKRRHYPVWVREVMT